MTQQDDAVWSPVPAACSRYAGQSPRRQSLLNCPETAHTFGIVVEGNEGCSALASTRSVPPGLSRYEGSVTCHTFPQAHWLHGDGCA